MKIWKSLKYKNLTFLALSFLFAFLLSLYQPFHQFLFTLNFFAALVAGALFVSTFSAPIGAVTLLILAEKLPLLEMGIIALLGAVIADFTLFRFVKDGLSKEIIPVYEELGGNHINKILHTKHFRWLLPVAGAIIIASPIPQLGISLLGIPKLKNSHFLMISSSLNLVGVIVVLFLSLFLKP